MEREIIIRVFVYEDDKIDLPGNTLSLMNCSFMAPVEMKQLFYNIRTDSKKPDKEVVEYYVASMKSAGISVSGYETIGFPMAKRGKDISRILKTKKGHGGGASMKIRYCRACRAAIGWIETKYGQVVPVDIKQHSFVMASGETARGYISHYKTCPLADQSKDGRQNGQAAPEGKRLAWAVSEFSELAKAAAITEAEMITAIKTMLNSGVAKKKTTKAFEAALQSIAKKLRAASEADAVQLD